MPEKYLYKDKVLQRKEVEDAAKQSGMDIDTYYKKAGLQRVNDNYDFKGKKISAEDVFEAAKQSGIGFDDYIQKAEITALPDEKKKLVGKVGLESSSLESGNSLSQSSGVDGSQIPTIQLTDEEVGIFDPITESLKAKENSNKTQSIGVTGETSEEVPDLEAKKQSDIQRKSVTEKGYDPDKLARDFEGVDYQNHKEELLEDYKTNPQVYERKLSRIKWKSGLDKELNTALEKGALNPEEYDNLQFSINSSLENSSVGDYKQQRENVNSVANAIKQFGGENKDKLLSEYATEISKVYGNSYKNNFSKAVEGAPESKYLNEEAQLGLHYIKDLDSEKAAQYDRLLIDPKTLKDKPDELRGYNHLMQTLEETGVGLQQNAVTEDLNNLKKIAEKNGGLTPEQITEATALEAKNEELSQKRNELDNKYPDRIENKVDDAMQEILGQKISGFNYAGGKAFEAIKNTGKGIWEAVSSPFMSNESNNLRELAIMGETLEENKIYHKTDKNKNLLTDTLVIQSELQSQIDGITNNKVMSNSEKEQRLYRLLRDNTDKFGRVPIQDGKFNISPSSVLYGLTDLGTSLLPFVAAEYLTGGIGGSGSAAKFLRTFTAAAATTFHDEYANAIMEGKTQSDAYKSAMGVTAINSLAMAGAGTPTEIRGLVKPNSSAAKIIAQMTDKEIQSVLSKGTPKGLKSFGQSLKQRAIATPAMVGQGLKTGAKFEGYMTAANITNDREVNWKQSVLGIANFGMAGGGLGHIGYKSPTELQKSGLVSMGEKPEEFHATALDMKKDGILSPSEYAHRVDLIDRATEAYKTLPKANDKGNPLDEKQKGEYLYNSVIKNEGNKAKSTLPPRQAEKAEMTAMIADHANGIILEEPTDKQLESRKSSLEKQLEKKDEEGKLELTDKDRKDAQAELEAVKEAIENKPPEIKGEPEDITKPIELSTDTKPTDVVVDNLAKEFDNHYNNNTGISKEAVPVEIINKLPDYAKDNIYRGIKKDGKEGGNSWTFDEETALAMAGEGGKVISMPIKEFKEKYDFVSLDRVNDYLSDKGKENDAYVSESEIISYPKEQSLSTKQGTDVVGSEVKTEIKNEPTEIKETIEVPNTEKESSVADLRPDKEGSGAEKGTGKFEAKARKIAEKIQATELPDWLKVDDTNAKKSGVGADELKKALAEATIKMGQLLDKGVEFTDAVKEAVKDLVDLMGEGMRGKIEEGFTKDYKEKTGSPKEGTGDPEDTKIANAINDQLIKDKFGVEALDGIIGQLADTDLSKTYGAIKERVQKGVLDPKVTREKVLTQKSGNAADQAILLYDMAQLKGQEKDIRRQIIESNDTKEKEQLQRQLVDVQNSMMDNALANRHIGRDWHNIGKIRQQWINKDFNIIDMQNEYMASKGISELTPEQKADIQKFHDTIKDLEVERDKAKEDLDKVVAESERLKAENEKLKQLKGKAPRVKRTEEQIAKSNKRIQDAKDELRKMRGQMNDATTVIPKAALLISKMAAEKVYQGVVEFRELVRDILDDVKDIFPEWKEKDVADHLLNEGANYQKYYEAGKKYDASNKELQAKIKAYNELNKKYALKMFEWQKDRRSDLMEKRPLKEKMIDSILRWQRFAILSYPSTLVKLAAVVGHQLVLKPFKFGIQKFITAPISKALGIHSKQTVWAEPTWRSLGKYYSEVVRNFSLANLKEQFGGIDTKEMLYGNKFMYDEWAAGRGLLEMPGRSHGYIKSFIKNPEFKFAQENIATQHIAKMAEISEKLKNDKLTEEERDKLKEDYDNTDVTNPEVMERINKLSLEHGKWAILMNDNNFTKKFQAWTSNNGFSGALAKSELPIVKIPLNYIYRAFATKYGLIRAITGKGRWESKDNHFPGLVEMVFKGTKDLTPEQADIFARCISLGSMGATFFTMGYLMRKNIQQNDDGSFDIFGMHINKNLIHSPEFESIFSGAETGHEFDKKGGKGADNWIKSFVESDIDIAKKSPFVNMMKYGFTANLATALLSKKDNDTVWGKITDATAKKISDMAIPGAVKQSASATDVKGAKFDIFSKPTYRKPEGTDLQRFWQTFELAIPGLRKNVPEGELNEKFKNYTKNGKPITDKDIVEFEKLKQELVDRNIGSLKKNGIGKTKYKDLTKKEITDEESYIKTKADSELKNQLFEEKWQTDSEMIKEVERDISRDTNYNFTINKK